MTDLTTITEQANTLAEQAAALQAQTQSLQEQLAHGGAVDPFVFGLTVLVLACFVGYYVVWRVTPALHTPLMSVTNAISGVIIVGAVIALGPESFGFSHTLGFIAVTLASINIFGGFVVTQRMLAMFKKKERK
ncbi:MAG: NAD(P) transhydrogenase subunit alpha [Alphaproteobacteria bacterium]|nr:NAD(P) transhydrogenase subunit alpha [Alphaproteobacteria bacterium]